MFSKKTPNPEQDAQVYIEKKASHYFALYFILYNALSALFFGVTIWYLDLDKTHPYSDLYWVFSIDFLIFYLLSIGLSYFYGGIARFIVFFSMKYYYQNVAEPETMFPLFSELNEGQTGLWSIAHFMSTLISMFIYCAGVVYIIQEKLFGANTMLTLLLSYFLIKGIVSLYIYFKYKFRKG
jgi:hypothetical protein